jgi:hypothetical protein
LRNLFRWRNFADKVTRAARVSIGLKLEKPVFENLEFREISRVIVEFVVYRRKKRTTAGSASFFRSIDEISPETPRSRDSNAASHYRERLGSAAAA